MSFMTVLHMCILYLIMLEMGTSEHEPPWTAVWSLKRSSHLCWWGMLYSCSLPPSHPETGDCQLLMHKEFVLKSGWRAREHQGCSSFHRYSWRQERVRQHDRHYCQHRHRGSATEETDNPVKTTDNNNGVIMRPMFNKLLPSQALNQPRETKV